ncbi:MULTISPECIES: site-2 protease family protein [Clostridium]|uniref:Site-2 protease family protein n=1 Tax=Clostridium paridis TaxID=2803863 RepID=A0A937K511_9CLOT|nr:MULTISPECIES: site-2 protease family protein [Clostridium]MBL4932083.1 site-2 protease family protein [Clostridium paridis]
MNFMLTAVLSIPAILVAFTFHEYAHAWMADRLGDKTARFQGRLTLNPLAHVDPMGFIMILIFGFGWAKPTPVNPRAFKNYYKDDLKVSIAGPLANLIVAIIFAVITGIFFRLAMGSSGDLAYLTAKMLLMIVTINVNLFFFNLLPVPGFDGFNILEDLFPSAFRRIGDQIYKYQMIIFFIVVFFAWKVISGPSALVIDQLLKLMYFVANLF